MHCHGQNPADTPGGRPVILIGNPNVGKSAIFGALSGRYVEVSNYPGTTVELARGKVAIDGTETTLIDTPGVASLLPRSDDERVARDVLLNGSPWAVVQVADAKNLRRALLLTFQLAEQEVPFVLDLNMADEAEALGIRVNAERLAQILGADVVKTVATRGEGIAQLRALLASPRPVTYRIRYDGAIEEAVARIVELLPDTLSGRRALALTWLAGEMLQGTSRLPGAAADGNAGECIRAIVAEAAAKYAEPLGYVINRQRLKCADCLVAEVWSAPAKRRERWAEKLGRLAIHPIWGWPILALALVGLYQFVGRFGAGVLVNWMEQTLFGQYVNPFALRLAQLIPFELARELLVGKYGLITMALSYGIAIVLPIVFTFFLAFSLLEDSGYLPRLAVMANRPFKAMGLNGKAVLPMVLGLGCDTMATLTTRILETRKERVQVTLLLALGVPCSAQLGVLLGMMAFLSWQAVLVWLGVVVATLFGVGWLAARLLPGRSSDFILELPPIRLPQLGNVVVKTLARLEWYLKEVLPLFVLGTAVLFALDKAGALAWLERLGSPVVVGLLGLPPETAGVFLIGFLRRDFGAAGLFTLARAGQLDHTQMVVSLVVITLFIPCIANLLMIAREHGRRTAFWVAAFVFPFAFGVGGVLNLVLRALRMGF
ncbi:MAG: ferrous iron transport protein B [Chloroflexi bacterium]|nr:ferrous iron transport protein B [Chloroflexota bacterium]